MRSRKAQRPPAKKLGLIFPTNIDEIFPPNTFFLASALDKPKAKEKEY